MSHVPVTSCLLTSLVYGSLSVIDYVAEQQLQTSSMMHTKNSDLSAIQEHIASFATHTTLSLLALIRSDHMVEVGGSNGV